ELLLDSLALCVSAGAKQPEAFDADTRELLVDEKDRAVEVEGQPLGFIIPSALQGAGQEDLAVVTRDHHCGGAGGFGREEPDFVLLQRELRDLVVQHGRGRHGRSEVKTAALAACNKLIKEQAGKEVQHDAVEAPGSG